MKLSDFLSEENLSQLAKQTINVGDVYGITMTEANGITLKNGYPTRYKYFVVLGFDCNGVAYGGVIINSQINPNLPQRLKMLHMPISCAKYKFLEYDSFVDCARLMEANPQKFNEWTFLGAIDNDDVELIIGTIKESPVESVERLSRFGL